MNVISSSNGRMSANSTSATPLCLFFTAAPLSHQHRHKWAAYATRKSQRRAWTSKRIGGGYIFNPHLCTVRAGAFLDRVQQQNAGQTLDLKSAGATQAIKSGAVDDRHRNKPAIAADCCKRS